MKCPHCNTAIVNGAKFCHHCGNVIMPPKALTPDCNNGKWGYVDETGNIVIPHQYAQANSFEDGQALVKHYEKKDGYKWLVIDSEGNKIKELDYTRIDDFFYDGIALVDNGGLYGYINETGKEIVPVAYRNATIFKNGYAAIDIAKDYKDGKQWIYIDKYGEQISKNFYDNIGLNVVPCEYGEYYGGNGYGYNNVDYLYYERYEPQQDCWGFSNERAKVCNDGKWGFIDATGKEIIPLQYDAVNGFINRYYTAVQLGDKWGIIDRLGNNVIPIMYDEIRLFSDNSCVAYATLQKDEKWGVVKMDFGEVSEIAPYEYSECYIDIDNKLISVRNEKYGLLDLDGKEIIPLMYDWINPYISPDFLVIGSSFNEQGVRDGKQGVIDWNNNTLIPFAYDFRGDDYYSEGYFWIYKDGKRGAINLKGEEVIPCIYDLVYENFMDGIALVKKGDSIFYVDYYGNEMMCRPNYFTSDEIRKLLSLKANSENEYLYLFFDTETTGTPQDYKAAISDLDNWPRLAQLAWILCDEKGNELLSLSSIIKPNGFSIPTEASNIHGITTEIAVREGIDLEIILNSFIEVANMAHTVICHNTGFDNPIIGAELLRVGSDFKIDSKPSICTMLSSKNYCAIPNPYQHKYGDPYKWPKLQELHKKLFGVEFEDAHDAMADIQATKKCFFELLKRNIISI